MCRFDLHFLFSYEERRGDEGIVPYVFAHKSDIYAVRGHGPTRMQLQAQSLHRIISRLCRKMIGAINPTAIQTPARWGCP
jgi:hypothetical protein